MSTTELASMFYPCLGTGYHDFSVGVSYAVCNRCSTVVELDASSSPQEVTHRSPLVGSGVTECCYRIPSELPRHHRLTLDPGLVTCSGQSGRST